jgi:putative transposase
MLKAVKVKLYPNNNQEIYINKLLGCNRFVYNKCLEYKIERYKQDKSNIGLKDLGEYLFHNLLKNEEYSFLNVHNTKVLNQPIFDLLDAYKRFFINGNGFPKFRSKKDNILSCRFPVQAISKNNNYLLNRITLTGQLKNIKFRCSDNNKTYLTKYKGSIKSVTLSKTCSGNYFLSILVDGNIEKVLPKPVNTIVGIDLGIKDFLITSNGEKFENIKSIRNNEKKLKRLYRQLSRKKRIKTGEFKFSKKWNKEVEITRLSNNGQKARIKLAKAYEKINNIKENYLH